MTLEQKRIFRISDAIGAINPQQIAVQATADTDLGFKMYGGKDDEGNVTKWLAKDKPGRLSTLGLIGGSTTGDDGILRHDTNGDITGGPITIGDLNDLISDGEVGLWTRDAGDGVLIPKTDTDKIRVGDGGPLNPGVAFKGNEGSGICYDDALDRIYTSIDSVRSWEFDRADDVHRIFIGDDQTAPNQRYFHIKWEESDYESRSVARIENYRGSGAPGADGTFTISNNIQDGTFGTMTLTNFHPGNSTTYISATGSGATKVDISATGATAEIKNTADKITFYGQAQADPADSAAAPDYSFVGYTGAGMRYNTSDDTLRFGLGGTDLMSISTAAGVSFELKPLADMKYFSIIHDLSTGSDDPFFTIKAAGSGTADGAHIAIIADGSTDADTDTIAEFYSDGGAAYTIISSHAHGLTRNSETTVKSTSDDDTSATKLYARSDSSDSADAAAISIYNENRGAGNSYIYIYGDSHFGTGQSYIYLGFSENYWTDVVYFGDDNRTGASPAWTSPGVPLSTNTAAWNNYKSTFGEVGLMDAMYTAATQLGGFTAGSIPFANGSGVLTEDTSYLYYKNTGFNIATINASGAATSSISSSSTGGDCDMSIKTYAPVNYDTELVISGLTSGTGVSEVTISADGGGTGSFLLLETPPGDSSIRIDEDVTIDDGNRSGSTWTSAGIPLSNGTAQWTNMEQLMSGEYSIFYAIRSATNDYRDSGESEGTSTTTSTSWQQKLRVTTPSLTSGKGYYILWQCEIGADADNDVYARVQLDDSTTIAEPYFDNNPDAARWRSVSGFYYSDTLSGTVDIDIDYTRAYGSGTVRIRRARILVLRANIQPLV